MKVKDLIAKLKTLDPEKQVMISNQMGSPAYDYEGQRFKTGFDAKSKTITIVGEKGA